MMPGELLIDVATRLGWLLQRPDLTTYERERYQTDLFKLVGTCLQLPSLEQEQKWQIALSLLTAGETEAYRGSKFNLN